MSSSLLRATSFRAPAPRASPHAETPSFNLHGPHLNLVHCPSGLCFSTLSQGSVLLIALLSPFTPPRSTPFARGLAPQAARSRRRAALAGLHLTSALSSSCLRRSRPKIWLIRNHRLLTWVPKLLLCLPRATLPMHPPPLPHSR